jgi:biotin transport system substrate-specific component
VSTNTVTLRSAVLPRSGVLTDAVLVTGGAAFVALAAQISVHTSLTPVPFTLQTFAVLLTGATLGSLRGTLSLALYLLVGMVGAPVFEKGSSGLHVFSGATGGYLVGMLIAAALTGLLAERRWDHRVASAVPAMLLGNLVVFVLGAGWLAHVLHVGAAKAISLGVTPFLLAELAKLVVAGLLLPGAWRLVERTRG